MTPAAITLGSRGSQLAVRQTEQVRTLLGARWPRLVIQIRTYTTSGDEHLDVPFTALADDAFTDQLEQALRRGEIDAVVHSYKDLPSRDTPELVIAAVPVRADVREALVSRHGHRLADLPHGATVGTSSMRRTKALQTLRPDLQLRPIRGPVDARLAQVLRGDFDAVIFAAAGLHRLGMEHHISEYFSEAMIPYAAGQGALAVQCRAADVAVRTLIEGIDDATLHAIVRAERAAEAGAHAP